MVITTLLKRWCLALGLGMVALPSVGAEVVFNAGNFPDEGVEYLRGASLVLQTAENPESTAQDLVAAARADYGRMVGALYQLGHYGGSVSIRVDGREAADISPLAGPTRIDRISVQVEPGPTFTFGTARITPLSPATALPEGFTKGQRAFSKTIEEAATAGIEGWRNIGHAKAGIEAETVTADHRNSTILADIRLRPGPRLLFGNLNIGKPGKVRPNRVREIAGLPTGKVFSPAKLEQASDRLRRTGAFRSVVLEEADQIGPGDTLDINATLVDAKPKRVGLGVELSSLEGVTLSGFWMHRNLLGGAERLRFEAEVSGIGGDSGGIDYMLSARFDRPATFTPDTSFFVEASLEELNDPNYKERNARIGTGLTHLISRKLTGELGIAYQYSEITDTFGSRTLDHLLLPARLTFENRNEPLNATSGSFVDLELTPFYGIRDNVAGARVYLDVRGYREFGPDDRFVFAARGQMGSVLGAGLTEVPSDMLFYSGGAGTVRGQPYQSLGVDLGPGMQIGGRSFLGLSAELRSKLFGPWSVVGFADTGFVGQDSWGAKNGGWHSGAGVGARYDTGFGPIRVDVATPLDSGAGSDFELYIGIGQAF